MKYTLIANDEGGHKIIHKFNEECLSDVLRHIQYFLSGCSFVLYPNEELIIVTAEEYVDAGVMPNGKKKKKK